MITLYQGPSAWGVPNLSPFCVKVETWLKFAEVPYETKVGDIRKSPKGKIPWIVHGDITVSDSSDILDYLVRELDKDLDADLDAQQRAVAHSIQRTLEEHLYFATVYDRWMTDAGYQLVKPIFQEMMPPIIGALVVPRIRTVVRKSLHGQGMGRHSEDEMVVRATKDLAALSDLLGEQNYFFGDRPHMVDAAAFGQISGILHPPLDSKLRRAAQGFPNLVAYCDRIQDAYFK